MNYKQRKAKILEDIAAAQEKGYTLVREEWGSNSTMCACALGCVNIANGTKPDDQESGGAAQVLGVDQNWINSFIDGFDGNGRSSGAYDPEAWSMGSEIAEETNSIPYTEFVDQMDEQ